MPDKSELPNEAKAAHFLKKVGRYWKSVLDYMETNKVYKAWKREAKEAQTFYTGRGDIGTFYGRDAQGVPDLIQSSSFRYKYNKVFEFIRILAPELYYRNPTVTVNVRNSYSEDGEFIEQMSYILRDCINYHYDEIDFVAPRRKAITNFLLSGRGVIRTIPDRLPDGTLIVREQSIPFNDFIMDPDAKRMEDVTWMGHRHVLPKTSFIKKFGKEANRLYSQHSNPNELIEYYTIYSKLGLFGGLSDEFLTMDEFKKAQAEWGDYVKMTIIVDPYYENEQSRGEAYNRDGIPPRVIKIEKWEVPFWKDTDPTNRWPYTILDSHTDPDNLFPISPVACALGEARMVNWFATTLAIRQISTTRSIVGLHPGVDEKTLEKLQNSMDMSFIQLPVDDTGKVNNAFTIQSLEADLSSTIQGLEYWKNEFDVRTGLAEVKYISPTQSRSAEDAAQKGRVANRTIDGLFSVAEMGFTILSRKHGFAWRYLANRKDVAKIVGDERAVLWDEYQNGTMEEMIRDYNIQIIGDTMRRPDKAAKLEQATLVMESLMGIAAQVGDLEAINAIVLNWQEEMGVPDWKKIQFNPPPPPEPEPAPAPPPPEMVEPTMMPPDAEMEGTSIDIMPGGA